MYPAFINKIANNRNQNSLSHRFRQERFSIFLDTLEVTTDHKILDVGGHSDTWINTGFEKNVTLLNITKPNTIEQKSGFKYVQGNALNMHMFEDQRFDIVFSNSVIEHVGSIQNQRKFAAEVNRVGKSYWIQTPNIMFPIEPHFLFPFFQFLPEKLKIWVSQVWKYSHIKQWKKSKAAILEELASIRLLSKKEMLQLFSAGSLYEEKYLLLTKSIVMYRKSERVSVKNEPRINISKVA